MMRFPFLLVSGLAFFLMACSDNTAPKGLEETTDPVSADPILLTSTERCNISEDMDRHQLIFSLSIATCAGDSTVIVEDTLHSFLYQIRNGQLYLWDSLQCQALRFSGGHTTVEGLWTYQDTAAFPVENWTSRINPNCQNIVDSIWQERTLNLTSSYASIISVRDSFCLARDEAAFQDLQDRGLVGATIIREDCQSFSVVKGNHTGTLSITSMDLSSQAYALRFTYLETTCTLSVTASTTCSQSSTSNTAEFSLCVLGSGI